MTIVAKSAPPKSTELHYPLGQTERESVSPRRNPVAEEDCHQRHCTIKLVKSSRVRPRMTEETTQKVSNKVSALVRNKRRTRTRKKE